MQKLLGKRVSTLYVMHIHVGMRDKTLCNGSALEFREIGYKKSLSHATVRKFIFQLKRLMSVGFEINSEFRIIFPLLVRIR